MFFWIIIGHFFRLKRHFHRFRDDRFCTLLFIFRTYLGFPSLWSLIYSFQCRLFNNDLILDPFFFSRTFIKAQISCPRPGFLWIRFFSAAGPQSLEDRRLIRQQKKIFGPSEKHFWMLQNLRQAVGFSRTSRFLHRHICLLLCVFGRHLLCVFVDFSSDLLLPSADQTVQRVISTFDHSGAPGVQRVEPQNLTV